MQQKVKTLFNSAKNNKVVAGSFIMIAGGFLGSFSNYLYHLVMARSLGLKDYGILESLISIIYLLNIILATLSLVIAKYVASYKGKNETDKISSFFYKLLKTFLIIVPLVFIILAALTPAVSRFLHLSKNNSSLYVWILLAFCLGIYGTVGKSFLQGLSRFMNLTLSGLFDGIFRLLIAVIFILLGWRLAGAVVSFFIAAIFSLIFTAWFVRDLFSGKKNLPITEKNDIFKYIFPVFFTNLGLTSLITSDVILVRHFLSADSAGIYSALSTLGKIIFFAASPVTTVIFPLVAESHAGGRGVKKEAVSGILLIAAIILGILAVFGLFPKLMVGLLFGAKYYNMISLVFLFAVGMSFYTLDSLILNIFLAQKKNTPPFLVLFAAALQISLIFLYHQELSAVVRIFTFVSALLFSLLLLYYFYDSKKNYKTLSNNSL